MELVERKKPQLKMEFSLPRPFYAPISIMLLYTAT